MVSMQNVVSSENSEAKCELETSDDVSRPLNEPLEVDEFGAGTRTRWMFLPWDARFSSSLLGRSSSLESQKLKTPTQNLDPL